VATIDHGDVGQGCTPGTIRQGDQGILSVLRVLPALLFVVTGTKIERNASGNRHADSPQRELRST